jgi:hypothetical protein
MGEKNVDITIEWRKGLSKVPNKGKILNLVIHKKTQNSTRFQNTNPKP